MRAALVENELVTNVIEIDAEGYPGAIPCTDEVEIGWSYDGTTFTAPPPPPPPPATADDVDSERNRRASQMAFEGKVYQTGRTSYDLVSAWGASANHAVQGGAAAGDLRWADPAKDFVWIDAANAEVLMDAQTMAAFATATMQWDSANILAARALKNMNPIPADYASDQYWPTDPGVAAATAKKPGAKK